MRSDSEDAKKSVSDSKTRVYGIIALCVLLLYILMAALGLLKQIHQKPSKPSPPVLSRCTHIEIKYPSIIKALIPPMGFDPNFLSAAETEYLQSLEKIVIDDKKSIKAFARQVSSGTYKIIPEAIFPMKYTPSLVCYRNDERIALITKCSLDFIVTENGHSFVYDRPLPKLLLLAQQQIRPLVLRAMCGGQLWFLYDELHWASRSTKVYPAPTKWCDIIVRDGQNIDLGGEKITDAFKCPAVDKGKRHYALNPNCEPNSPPDIVLLFETKGGWNQHGGPELFTFDNHDPKGGCVLLNDGTVKFIRTKEELQQLRWN